LKEKKKIIRKTVKSDKKRKESEFPIIGIGASAGGLEAFEKFFKALPSNSGLAFVLIQHLDPDHSSMLSEILQRVTSIPVIEIKNGLKIVPNCIYVIPPNKDVAIFNGKLILSVPENPRGLRLPIDFFFRSIAEELGEKSIGVILSGTGSDGTLGLRAIHGAGGVSFIQEPDSSKYDGMPSSAVNSGLATYVMPVEKIPNKLINYIKTLYKYKIKSTGNLPVETNDFIKVLMLIRSVTGHDFSLYKKSTLLRRIERRMSLHSIDNFSHYSRFLKEHPEEVNLLFKELLINVTNFFRDPEAFSSLKKNILPHIFRNKPENYIFRVWVAGCSTGEEAYSVAIALREFMDESRLDCKVQIYSTDIDETLISAARAGVYPQNITLDMPQAKLKKYFTKENNRYRVRKDIRDMIVFAVQNLIKDPPFTKLDLITCRNLLIYFEPELQNKIIPAFHYSLNPGGVLFLSPSESIGNFQDLFSSLDKKWKFFQSKATRKSAYKVLSSNLAWTKNQLPGPVEEIGIKSKEINFTELTKNILLKSFAPPSVITDEKGNILYVYGDTGKYLQPAPGHPTLNVIEMAREGYQLELRSAIHRVASGKSKSESNNVYVKTNEGFNNVNISVKTLKDKENAQEFLIISFKELNQDTKGKIRMAKKPAKKENLKMIEELEQELIYTKENLNASIEELQASNEEMKSTNEELQSTNEELQSTNEELETSKEELQSLNEELVTINAELQSKIEQLAGMKNDMRNIMDSTNIGTIFLDENLAVKLFNKEASKIYRLIQSDINRLLIDIKSNIIEDDILLNAQRVIDTLIPFEKEVVTVSNEWFLSRILPYRTLDNVIAGIVITFTDITKLKKAEEINFKARKFAENIVNTIREPILILDDKFNVVSAGNSFYRIFGMEENDTVGRCILNFGNGQWNIPDFKNLLEKIISENTSFENMEMKHNFQGLENKRIILNARRIEGQDTDNQLILLAIEIQ